jgi:hypothetical protein
MKKKASLLFFCPAEFLARPAPVFTLSLQGMDPGCNPPYTCRERGDIDFFFSAVFLEILQRAKKKSAPSPHKISCRGLRDD